MRATVLLVTRFERYRPPPRPWRALHVGPLLDSWNASIDPEQVALQSYLDRVEDLLRDHLPEPTTPLSLGLAVGLDPSKPLLEHRDLDNYLSPIARRMHQAGRQVVAAHASKSHTAGSSLAVEAATRGWALPGDERTWVVEVDASYEKPAYKVAIRDTVSGAAELPPGPVAVDLSFVVSPDRNWLSLWKPTIDALGPLLGHSPGAAEWNARDGRITQLALHCAYNPGQKGRVTVAIGACSLVLAPDVEDEWSTIEYALSYDGYAEGDVGFLSAVATSVEAGWNAHHALPNDTDDLRRTLFFLQRKHRANEDTRPFGTIPMVAAIVKELRKRSPSGLPNHPANL